MPPTFLGTLAPDDARALRAAGVERRFRAGDTLLNQDDDPGRVLVIERGRVRVSHVAGDGRETILGYSGPGDLVGEV
jgi:CRP-like cAMP-binding protein